MTRVVHRTDTDFIFVSTIQPDGSKHAQFISPGGAQIRLSKPAVKSVAKADSTAPMSAPVSIPVSHDFESSASTSTSSTALAALTEHLDIPLPPPLSTATMPAYDDDEDDDFDGPWVVEQADALDVLQACRRGMELAVEAATALLEVDGVVEAVGQTVNTF